MATKQSARKTKKVFLFCNHLPGYTYHKRYEETVADSDFTVICAQNHKVQSQWYKLISTQSWYLNCLSVMLLMSFTLHRKQ
jgi:hypothetical protein